MSVPQFHTRFTKPQQLGLFTTDETLTEKQFANDVDINAIVNGFSQNIPMPKQPIYGTVFNPTSAQDAINLIKKAESDFNALPSALRKEFDNNPHKFIDFCSNDKNYEKAFSLGLISKDNYLKYKEKYTIKPEKVTVN